MVQSPSWEANWFAASQEIPRISRNPKFHYRNQSVRHLSLSWASPIQSIYPHTTSWRSVLILSTHLCLGLSSGLLTSGFPTKTLHTPFPHTYSPHSQPISSSVNTPLIYHSPLLEQFTYKVDWSLGTDILYNIWSKCRWILLDYLQVKIPAR